MDTGVNCEGVLAGHPLQTLEQLVTGSEKELLVAGVSVDVDSTRKPGPHGLLLQTSFALESVSDMSRETYL